MRIRLTTWVAALELVALFAVLAFVYQYGGIAL